MDNLAQLMTGSSSFGLLLGISFLGGLIASVSPCSLSMLPLIVGYVGGCSELNPVKTFVQMLFFVLGTAIVFSAIGVICAVTGKVFVSFLGGYFGLILAGIILVMGLKLVGFLDFEIPVLVKELPGSKGKASFLYPVLLGGVFALVGTPCSTPILAGIMAHGVCIVVRQHRAGGFDAVFVCARSGLNPYSGRIFDLAPEKSCQIFRDFNAV